MVWTSRVDDRKYTGVHFSVKQLGLRFDGSGDTDQRCPPGLVGFPPCLPRPPFRVSRGLVKTPPSTPTRSPRFCAPPTTRFTRRSLARMATSPWKKSSGHCSTDENLRFSRTLRVRDRIPAIPQAVYPQPATPSPPSSFRPGGCSCPCSAPPWSRLKKPSAKVPAAIFETSMVMGGAMVKMVVGTPLPRGSTSSSTSRGSAGGWMPCW